MSTVEVLSPFCAHNCSQGALGVVDAVCVGVAAEAAELSHLATFGPACQAICSCFPAVQAHHLTAEPQSRLLVASEQRYMCPYALGARVLLH